MTEDKDKGSHRDLLNNRENAEGESIYGKFRSKILNENDKKIYDKVQSGAQTGYDFDSAEEDALSGEYVKKIEKKTVVIYVLISTVILTALILFGISLIPDAEDKFNQYKNLIAQVEKLNLQKNKKIDEIEEIIEELKKNDKYKDLEIDPSGDKILSEESMQYLSQQSQQEKNTGIKSQIDNIMQTDQEIKTLQQDIRSKNKILDPPVVMTRQRGHEQIAIDYLTRKKGLSRSQAKSALENVNVFDYTYEGLYVWNFYENGFYGSFITKGEADKSPNEIKKLAKNAFQERILDLEREKSSLKQKTKKLETDLKSSQAQVEALMNEKNKIDQLDEKNKKLKVEMLKKQDMISELNSIKYKLISYDFAIERGVISDTMWEGVKLKSDKGLDYSSKVDFSFTDNLIIRPNQFNLPRFDEVYVLPKEYISRGYVKILKKDNICKIEFINKAELIKKQILVVAK